jgi:hypothetical protein
MDGSVRQIARIELRRAVLGLLIDAAHPLTVADVEARLAAHGLVPFTWGTRTVRKLLADLLAHQWRIGRLRRVDRGVYEIVPTSISPSMRYRCGRALRDAARAMASVRESDPATPEAGMFASHHSDSPAPMIHGEPASD